MRPGLPEPRRRATSPNPVRKPLSGHRTPRPTDSQEHRPARQCRRPCPQVPGQSLSHLAGQRKPVPTGALAPNKQRAVSPVDVLQGEPRHLRYAQPQPGQQQQNRVVAATPLRIAVTRAQQRGHRRPVQPDWHGRQPPPRLVRNNLSQRPGNPIGGEQEPQQRPKPNSQAAHRWSARPHQHTDDLKDLPGRQPLQRIIQWISELPHEQARDVHVVVHSARCQATFPTQIAAERVHQLFPRTSRSTSVRVGFPLGRQITSNQDRFTRSSYPDDQLAQALSTGRFSAPVGITPASA